MNLNNKKHAVNENSKEANDVQINNSKISDKINNSNSSNSFNNPSKKKKKKKLSIKENLSSRSINNPNDNNNFNNLKSNSIKGIPVVQKQGEINCNSGMGVSFNGVYDANFIQNPNLNLINYNALLANNQSLIQNQINSGFPNTFTTNQNQLFVNPYNIHSQNLIGQQIPVSLNIPQHQTIAGSIPVNVQANGNYMYNYVGGIQNNHANSQFHKSNLNVGNYNIYQAPMNDISLQSKIFLLYAYIK